MWRLDAVEVASRSKAINRWSTGNNNRLVRSPLAPRMMMVTSSDIYATFMSSQLSEP